MTVYLVIFLPKTPCIHRIYMVLANPTYDSIFGGFLAKNTVNTYTYTVYIWFWPTLNMSVLLHYTAVQRCVGSARTVYTHRI